MYLNNIILKLFQQKSIANKRSRCMYNHVSKYKKADVIFFQRTEKAAGQMHVYTYLKSALF